MVEKARWPSEGLLRTRLDLLAFAACTVLGERPALLLIGEVAKSVPYQGAVRISAGLARSDDRPSVSRTDWW